MPGRIARRTTIAVALSLFLLTLHAVAGGPAQAATPVKVGAYEFPPYVTETGAGITQGLIALMNAAQSEFRFELVATSPQRRYEDMEQGRFDIIAFESVAWGWRDRPVDATRVFLRDAELFVAKAGPGVDQSIFATLAGKTILGRLGYHYAFADFNSDPAVLEARYHTRVTVTHEGNVRSVAAGRATLAIVTQSFLNQFLKTDPDLARRLLVSERADQIYEHTILVRRGGPITAGRLNALLDQLEADGQLSLLWDKSGITE